jgi:hypothetical protein
MANKFKSILSDENNHINHGGLRIVGNNESADQGTAFIRSNGDYLVLNAADGEHVYLNWDGANGGSGDVYVRSNIYAEALYDRGSTAYYLNPAGTSKLLALKLEPGSANNVSGGDNVLWIYRENDNDWGVQIDADQSTASDYGFEFLGGSSHSYAYSAVASGTRYFTVGSSYSQHDGSFRSPIFYDSADTTYYTDPASTGTSLKVAGGIITTAASGSILLEHQVSEANAWLFQESAGNWGTFWFNAGSETDYTFGGYTTVGAEFVGFRNGTATNSINPSAWTGIDTTAHATWLLSNYNGYIWSAGTQYSATDMRAPIFYDSNDTSYYVNPAGDSQMDQIHLANYVRHLGDLDTYFGFNGADQWKLHIGGGDRVVANTSTLTSNLNFQAPIFYDSNDTNYYVNPAGGAVIQTLTIDDYIYHKGDTNTYLYFENDSIKLRTGGTDRLVLNDYEAYFERPVVAPNLGRNNDDQVLFAITEQDTSETIRRKFGNTGLTAITKVDDSTAPADGCFQLTDQYENITIPQFFKVDDNSEYTFEVWVKFVSGSDTDQKLYAGCTFYDSSKTSLGNTQRYWGESGEQIDSNTRQDGNWYHFSGTLGPNRGSNTGDIHASAQWMKLILLLNYADNANTVRYCGLKFYKSGGRQNRMFTSIYRKSLGSQAGSADSWLGRTVMDTSGNLYTPEKLIHSDDTDTYFSFSAENQISLVAAGTTRLRVEGDVKVLGTTDLNIQGTSRRLQFTAGTGTVRTTTDNNLYLEANNITRQTISTGGYSQEAGSYRAPIFYDSGNTNYYVNPNDRSSLYEIFVPPTSSATDGARIRTYAWNDPNWGFSTFASNPNYHVRVHGYGNAHGTDRQFQVVNAYASNAVQFAVNFDGTGTAIGAAGTESGYKLTVHGSVHMKNDDINYVNQLHFNDNVRFYDDGNDNYLNFKWGDTAQGGIKFRDGDGVVHGFVYGSGSGAFGLLDKDGNWAFITDGATYTALRSNNNEELVVYNDRVEIAADLRSPIYYDKDDTAYYVSPNTTSVLRKSTLWESMGTITIRSEGENHLRINRSGSGYSFALYNDDLNDDANNDATNWEVEFDMLMNTSTHQGFAFNVVDYNDFYAVIFRDTANTVRVQKQVNGTQTYPIAETSVYQADGSTAIDLDDGWHHVRIQKSGVYIVIEVDGVTQVSTSIEDTLSHTYGKIGFTTYDNQCEYKNIVIKRGATQTLILGSSVTKGSNNYGVYADDNLVLTDGSLSIYPHRRGDYGLNATTATSTTFRSKLNIWSDNEDHITFGGNHTHMVSAWEYWRMWINNDSTDAGHLQLYNKNNKVEFARLSGGGTNSFILGTFKATGDLRAPIFYDSDNTAYKFDGAGTTNANQLTATRMGVNPTGSSTTRYGISLYSGYAAGEPTYGIMFTGTSGLGTYGSVTSDWATYFTMNDNDARGWIFRKVGSGNTSSISAGGVATFGSSTRSPIFYDNVDTNYYVDPANTGTAVYVKGDVVAYGASDERLKDNIKPIENALDKVCSLSGNTFEWNKISHRPTGKKDIGVIAQEVEKVFPEIVDTRDSGYKAVDYEKLSAVLIEAVKELKTEIEELKDKCNGCTC